MHNFNTIREGGVKCKNRKLNEALKKGACMQKNKIDRKRCEYKLGLKHEKDCFCYHTWKERRTNSNDWGRCQLLKLIGCDKHKGSEHTHCHCINNKACRKYRDKLRSLRKYGM